MPSFPTDPTLIIAIITAISGILAALLPLLQVIRGRLRKELTYKVLSNGSLVHANAQNAVQIFLKDDLPSTTTSRPLGSRPTSGPLSGRPTRGLLSGYPGTAPSSNPIPDADLLVFSIRNTGNANIVSEDYINNKPLGFSFPGQQVISVTDVKTEPDPGLLSLSDVKSFVNSPPTGQISSEIVLERPELNKKSSVVLSVLIRGGNGSDRKIEHFGGLRDGDIKIYRAPKMVTRRTLVIGSGVFLMLVSVFIGFLPGLIASLSLPGYCYSGSIAVGGSTALRPLVSTMAQSYHERCPQSVISINQNVTSSKAGLEALESSTINIGDSDLTSSNLSLSDNKIAAVIYVVVINMGVTQVQDLSQAQIQGIYNGSITNWHQINSQLDQPIFVVNRTSTSGTRATFEKYLLGQPSTPLASHYEEEDTSGLMANKVAATPGAIGYVDVRDALQTNNLKTLTIDGIQATSDNVKSNKYSFWTLVHVYTQGNPTDLTNGFIQYIKEDKLKLTTNLGYVPFNDIPSGTLNHHPSPTAPDGL